MYCGKAKAGLRLAGSSLLKTLLVRIAGRNQPCRPRVSVDAVAHSDSCRY